ncbi:MAG: NADH-quinone oxidoreductase subunit NuoE [Bacteroidales bacterium]|nr:NADH-quinone oxidoreductase subunit NuoE [Bacteroidales bacterium]
MRVQRIQQKPTVKEQEIEEIDINLINPLIKKHKGKKGSLIPMLQGTQDLFGYIPEEAFLKLSEEAGHELSTMYGVATFYAQFRLAPVGKYVVKVCHGTACHVQNAKKITETLKDVLKVADGETTEDKMFTLESVACLGCCSLAPVMMIGDDTYGKLTDKSTKKVIRQIKNSEK